MMVSRIIVFSMNLDTHYVYIHSKSNVSEKNKTSYNLKQREYNSSSVSSIKLAKGLFSFQNFAKFFNILRHIESLDACMKH
jgi:hypothetical protein